MLQTDLGDLISDFFSILIAFPDIGHSIPMNRYHGEFPGISIFYQQEQCVSLIPLDSLRLLLYRFIRIDAHKEIGSDFRVVLILFSTIRNNPFRPLSSSIRVSLCNLTALFFDIHFVENQENANRHSNPYNQQNERKNSPFTSAIIISSSIHESFSSLSNVQINSLNNSENCYVNLIIRIQFTLQAFLSPKYIDRIKRIIANRYVFQFLKPLKSHPVLHSLFQQTAGEKSITSRHVIFKI